MDELSLGERISLMRRRRNMTQSQLAVMTQTTQTEIHRLETGLTKDPHISRLKELCKALHVSADWLLGLDTD